MKLIYSFECISKENRIKIVENDTIFFSNIENIKYSPDLKYFVVNPISATNRITVFNKDGKIYKSYLIDDSYSDKYLKIINQNPIEDSILTTSYLRKIFGNSKDIYSNSVALSTFKNDSILITKGVLNYFINSKHQNIGVDIRRYSTVVLISVNIYTDEINVIPLYFTHGKSYPEAKNLAFKNNKLFLKLFPIDFFKDKPNGSKYVLGVFNFIEDNWKPILEIPKEYIDSRVKLTLDYGYRIATYKKDNYFMSPFLNYIFNLRGDTIKLSDLDNAIQFTLSKFNSDTLIYTKDLKMLDSLSHYNIDFFFQNDFLYIILNKPINLDGKVYLNKYNLKGNLIESYILNKDRLLESCSYSDNLHKIIKVYMENEEWYIEEVDFN